MTIDFGKVNQHEKFVIGRYPLIGLDADRFEDFKKNIQPYLKKNLGIIPGIRSAFVNPNDNLEFAVAIDYDKSESLFQSAREMKWRKESVLSMDFIKVLIKAHIQRTGILL